MSRSSLSYGALVFFISTTVSGNGFGGLYNPNFYKPQGAQNQAIQNMRQMNRGFQQNFMGNQNQQQKLMEMIQPAPQFRGRATPRPFGNGYDVRGRWR